MRAEKAVFYVLGNDAGVTGIVGTGGAQRIFSGRMPQNVSWPALSLHKISAVRRPPIRAGAGQSLVDARIQVTAYAQKYADVKTLAEAVRVALDRINGTYNGVTLVASMLDLEGPDGYDPDTQIYSQTLDYMVTHYE